MNILHIDSSITGDASASRELTAAIVASLKDGNGDAEVTYRDLAAEPLDGGGGVGGGLFGVFGVFS